MKTYILPILLLTSAIFSGCATINQKEKIAAPTHYNEAGQPTTEYPARSDPNNAYAYARGLWNNGEYREAAIWYEKAANSSTETSEWEFECFLNASVCWLEAGERDKASAALRQANELQVHAAPSNRARYMNALLLDGPRESLSPRLRATLPRSI